MRQELTVSSIPVPRLGNYSRPKPAEGTATLRLKKETCGRRGLHHGLRGPSLKPARIVASYSAR